jgi:DNA-binding response OmpR family regulator
MRGRARIGVRGEKGSLPVREAGVDAGAPFVEPRRVLYVERDHFTAALTRATLEDAGFDVDWFPAARAAVGPAKCARYDVYLLRVDGSTDGAASLASVASLAGGAGVVLVDGERSVGAAIQKYWLLPSPCPPRVLAAAVQGAARGRRRAA